MDTLTPLLAFVLASAAIEATPGPNMTYLAVLSMTRGRAAGFSAVAGVALGLLVIGLIAGLGAATLITQVPWAYQTLRYGGALYLIWLAYQTWRGVQDEEPERMNTRYFRDGLITNLLNPKAALFYIAVLPQFISSPDAARWQFPILVLIYVTVATTIHLMIVMASAKAQTFLGASSRVTMVRTISAIALCVIAGWVLWSTRI